MSRLSPSDERWRVSTASSCKPPDTSSLTLQRQPLDRENGPTAWRPLGKLLIEKEFLTRAQLEHALDEQRASDGRRLLGEILVGSGFLSGVSLARALAEQHGLELESGEIDVTTVLNTSAPGQALYQVREVLYEPGYQTQEVLYKSVSFLEAADFAAEFVEDLEPAGVEIERTHGTATETVWTYSKARADANANSREPLAKTFGFDPTLWDGANPRGPVGAARARAGVGSRSSRTRPNSTPSTHSPWRQ